MGSDEKLAKLADMMREEVGSLPSDEEDAGQSRIRIKGNSGNINFGTQLTIGERAESRKLVPAQRQELYDLGVKCEELGGDSKSLWRRVFAQLGVNRIDDITTEQFQQARGVLQANLDQLQEEADKRRLIGKILRATDEKAARSELNNFCELTFGRTQLNSLKRAELQRVLEFIQRFEVRPLATPAPQPPAAPSAPEGYMDTLRMLMSRYPMQVGSVFLAGVIASKIVL